MPVGKCLIQSYRRINVDAERIHVYPTGPLEPEHDDSPNCWCEPEMEYLDEFTGAEVWVHRQVQ